MADFTVTIEGMDEFRDKLTDFTRQLSKAMQAAGIAGATIIMNTPGSSQNYPPGSEANQPGRVDSHGRRIGYYVRKAGWYAPAKGGGYVLDPRKRSQRLEQGAQITHDDMTVTITISSAKVSYAVYVVGDMQARFHAARGWRQLTEIAESKRTEITGQYQDAFNLLLQQVGLK